MQRRCLSRKGKIEVVESVEHLTGKGTFWVARLRRRKDGRKRVRFGKPDVSLTGSAGVAALAELVDRLVVVDVLDEHLGVIKQRDRGVSAGQLLVALAQCQLLGGHGLVALDHQRPDAAWQWLSAVPSVPSTTAASLARRFGPEQLAGVESANARLVATALRMMPPVRRAALTTTDPTIDMDSTDVEVYGPRKNGWRSTTAASGRGGRTWPPGHRPASPSRPSCWPATTTSVPAPRVLLRRVLAAIPAEVTGRPRVRADAGYFTADLAHAADEAGCDWAIAAKRNSAMWRAYAGIGEHEWLPATDMPGAQRRVRLQARGLAGRRVHDRASGPHRRRRHLGRPAGPPAAHHPGRAADPRP